jgi:DNA-dependent RNA polymerase auxiliary subunit epsilon
MLGFRPLASQPLASGLGSFANVSENPVYGGWLPIKYLDRDGREVGLNEAPAQIAKDLAAERDSVAQEAIKQSVMDLIAQVEARRVLEDNQRAIEYLENMALEIQAAEAEAERLRWIRDPRVISMENENAITALLLEGSF